MKAQPALRRSPLHRLHEQLGATFTPFSGWQLPLRYTGELVEHRAVREAVGLFDISHMGEIEVRGPDAVRALDYATAGNIAGLAPGRACYTVMCNESGGIVDDLIIYRVVEEQFLVISNASNRVAVGERLADAVSAERAETEDLTEQRCLLSLQGPLSGAALALCTAAPLEELARFSIAAAEITGRRVLVARTGYTGEDGFEIVIDRDDAETIWTALMSAEVRVPVLPIGLAARDSLRLEAALPLYGHELSATTTPFEADLGRFVHLAKSFVGRDALLRVPPEQLPIRLVGLSGPGPRAARAGYGVLSEEGEQIGAITSGAPSPTLDVPIAMAYVPTHYGAIGTKLNIDLRGNLEVFEVVPRPFYRRRRPPTERPAP